MGGLGEGPVIRGDIPGGLAAGAIVGVPGGLGDGIGCPGRRGDDVGPERRGGLGDEVGLGI